MPIRCYAARAPKKTLEKFEYHPHDLGSQDIEVKITHCGICHSDIHLIDDDWGVSAYPLVPGHEIIGTVTAAGSDVRHLKIGQRVGVGWQRSACLSCEWCIRGDENLCPKNEATCVGHYGGFADVIRTDSRFAFAIPDGLASENAAPLLCGGITVYSPLRYYGVEPSMRVGVVGVGGLGHLGLQFARTFGCDVTAFTSTPQKEKEARTFGAHHVVVNNDPSAMKRAAGSLDFILTTANVDLDWNVYLNCLRPNGKLCFVGVPQGPLMVPAFALITGRKSVCGSPIGSRTMMSEMLEFAARHNIVAKTEVVPMGEVNAAIDRVRSNQARYRMVLRAQ